MDNNTEDYTIREDGMFKTYTLEDDSTFMTITIPKGTVLFHGMHIEKGYEDKLFYPNTGYPAPDNKSQSTNVISPYTQTFFYPVPYVSLTVDYFNFHIMFLTTYDLELLLLIKPSEHSREDRYKSGLKLIQTCSTISEKDACGYHMTNNDPCFTEYCMKNFNHLAGYIAIADTDQKRFIKLYKLYEQNKHFTELFQILSSVSSNSRGLMGIPEIVLHPLHRRLKECFYGPRSMYYNSSYKITYSIRHMYNYNYFPLLYFTKAGVHHITDFRDDTLMRNILNIDDDIRSMVHIKDIFGYINSTMEKLLSPEGYIIKDVKFNLTIDTRTGFYCAALVDTYNPIINYGNVIINYEDFMMDSGNVEEYEIPFYYNLKDKYKIMTILGTTSDMREEYDLRLGMNNMGLTSSYVLDKGDYKKYKQVFFIDNILKRLDIERKGVVQKGGIKYTHSHRNFHKILKKRGVRKTKKIIKHTKNNIKQYKQ
jgi:hypothetical protein